MSIVHVTREKINGMLLSLSRQTSAKLFFRLCFPVDSSHPRGAGASQKKGRECQTLFRLLPDGNLAECSTDFERELPLRRTLGQKF